MMRPGRSSCEPAAFADRPGAALAGNRPSPPPARRAPLTRQPAMSPSPPPGFPDHEAALRACAQGDPAGLRWLYEREARWLLGVAVRLLRDRAQAQEVLQDAFLQVWTRAGSFQPGRGSARGWIYTVLRHRALDVLRRQGREQPLDEVLHEVRVEEAPPGRLPGEVQALERCLARLDEAKRACILRAFVEGHTHEQIARHLATPVGTVKSWIRRGLLSLRECLS